MTNGDNVTQFPARTPVCTHCGDVLDGDLEVTKHWRYYCVKSECSEAFKQSILSKVRPRRISRRLPA